MKTHAKFTYVLAPLFLATLLCACNLGITQKQGPISATSHSLSLSFSGPSVSPSVTYASWVEDESGNNLTDIYICKKIAAKTLTGDALPYWTTVKSVTGRNLDAVTGPSVQGNVGLNVQRSVDFGAIKKIRVCFEIDRSVNSNAYFGDRPCFIYRSPIIDLDNPGPNPHTLTLYGWMSNGTNSGTYSQAPISGVTIPGFASYKLMTDLSYIADAANSWGDMVSALSISIN